MTVKSWVRGLGLWVRGLGLMGAVRAWIVPAIGYIVAFVIAALGVSYYYIYLDEHPEGQKPAPVLNEENLYIYQVFRGDLIRPDYRHRVQEEHSPLVFEAVVELLQEEPSSSSDRVRVRIIKITKRGQISSLYGYDNTLHDSRNGDVLKVPFYSLCPPP